MPFRVPGLTLQRNCASGMEAVAEAAAAYPLRQSGKAMLAGGAESMSTLPLLLPPETMEPMTRLSKARSVWAKANAITYLRPRHFRPVAALEQGPDRPDLQHDHGRDAEVLAHEFGISRQAQDEFALRSIEKPPRPKPPGGSTKSESPSSPA